MVKGFEPRKGRYPVGFQTTGTPGMCEYPDIAPDGAHELPVPPFPTAGSPWAKRPHRYRGFE